MTYPDLAPPGRYLRIPGSLVHKIRGTSLAVGAFSAIASCVVAVVTIWASGNLTIAEHPLTAFSTIMVVISALWAAVSSVALMLGRRYVVNDHVDLQATHRLCRFTLVMWIVSIVLTALSCFNLMMIAGTPQHQEQSVASEIAMFALLPVTVIVVTGTLFFVARRLLRPSPSLLRQHVAASVTRGRVTAHRNHA